MTAADDLQRLAEFKQAYPGVTVLPKAQGPVAYTIKGTVYGRDLAHLMDQLKEIYPLAPDAPEGAGR